MHHIPVSNIAVFSVSHRKIAMLARFIYLFIYYMYKTLRQMRDVTMI